MVSSAEFAVVGIQMADKGSIVENRPAIGHSFLQSGGLLDHRNTRVECLIPSRLSCRMFSKGKLPFETISRSFRFGARGATRRIVFVDFPRAAHR